MRVTPLRVVSAACAAAFVAGVAGCGGGSSSANAPPPVNAQPRGTLLSAELTGTVTKADSDNYLRDHPEEQPLVGVAASCDVQVYRLIYATQGPNGEYVQDSTGLQVPVNCTGPFPMLLMNHGTTILQATSLTTPGAAKEYVPYFSGDGYIVVTPDYSGYASSTLDYHPYQVAENGAVVTIDAVRAARQWLSGAGVVQSGKFFIFGSSQGGGVTMATQRAMERDYGTEFPITATVPTSGSYDLETSMVNILIEDGASEDPPAVSKATLSVTAYERAYGDIYGATTEVFQLPWANNVTGLLPGTMTSFELVDAGLLPTHMTGAGGLFTDAWTADFLNNPNNPMRTHLRENALISWTPRATMALCGSSMDPAVDFQNTLTAQAAFASRGVTVPVEDVQNDPAYAEFIAIRSAGRSPDEADGYHGDIVHTACQSYAKTQVFDPLR